MLKVDLKAWDKGERGYRAIWGVKKRGLVEETNCWMLERKLSFFLLKSEH